MSRDIKIISSEDGVVTISFIGRILDVHISGGEITSVHRHSFENARGHINPRKALAFSMNGGYLATSLRVRGVNRKLYLHEIAALIFIGERPDGSQIHHSDEDKLNNKDGNIEYVSACDHSSHHTRGRPSGMFSKYCGVCRSRSEKNPWQAYATGDNGKRVSLGLHATEGLAAEAFNRFAESSDKYSECHLNTIQ